VCSPLAKQAWVARAVATHWIVASAAELWVANATGPPGRSGERRRSAVQACTLFCKAGKGSRISAVLGRALI
jgi:hypothetical protein